MKEENLHKSKRYLHDHILNEHEKPVFTESTWGKIIHEIISGKYDPPIIGEEIKG